MPAEHETELFLVDRLDWHVTNGCRILVAVPGYRFTEEESRRTAVLDGGTWYPRRD